MLAAISTGVKGHGPIHLLLSSAAKIGFVWNPDYCNWTRPGLSPLHQVSSPWQVFQTSILQAWRNFVFADLCKREGFQGLQDGLPLFDREGSFKLLCSSHIRERDKALLRAILVGRVWNGFLLVRMRSEDFPCRFCGGVDGDGRLFWDCSFLPSVDLRESPEFSSLINLSKDIWPRFMLWHDSLPGLTRQSAHPWARNIQEVARYRLDCALGSYDPEPCRGWVLDEHFDAAEVVDCMPDYPNMWSDGSCVTDDLADIFVAGSGVFSAESGMAWNIRAWGHLDDVALDGRDREEGCRVLFSVPGPLQSVQRADLWGREGGGRYSCFASLHPSLLGG